MLCGVSLHAKAMQEAYKRKYIKNFYFLKFLNLAKVCHEQKERQKYKSCTFCQNVQF